MITLLTEKEAEKVYKNYDAAMVYSFNKIVTGGRVTGKENECYHSFTVLKDLLPSKELIRAVEDGTRTIRSVVDGMVSILKKPYRIGDDEFPSIHKTLFCIYTILSNENKTAKTAKGKMSTITIFILPSDTESKRTQLIIEWIKGILKVFGIKIASKKDVFKVVFGDKKYKKALDETDVDALKGRKISDNISEFNSKNRKKVREKDPDRLIRADETKEFIGLCCKPEYLLTAVMQDGILDNPKDMKKRDADDLARAILSVTTVSSFVRVKDFKGFSSKDIKKMGKTVSRMDKDCREYAIEFYNILELSGEEKFKIPKKYSESDKFMKSFKKAHKKLRKRVDLMTGMLAYIVHRRMSKKAYSNSSVKTAADIMRRFGTVNVDAFIEASTKLASSSK